MTKRKLALLAAALSGLASCTSQQLYDNAQGWREAECDQAIDTPRREACLKEARKKQ